MLPEVTPLEARVILIEEKITLLAMGLRELARALEGLLDGITILNREIKQCKNYLELP